MESSRPLKPAPTNDLIDMCACHPLPERLLAAWHTSIGRAGAANNLCRNVCEHPQARLRVTLPYRERDELARAQVEGVPRTGRFRQYRSAGPIDPGYQHVCCAVNAKANTSF